MVDSNPPCGRRTQPAADLSRRTRGSGARADRRRATRVRRPSRLSARACSVTRRPRAGSYFESLTVLGWLAGAAAGCDWQVLEVGLGGRLDTTNVVPSKEVAVITPIDLEHTAILGETIPGGGSREGRHHPRGLRGRRCAAPGERPRRRAGARDRGWGAPARHRRGVRAARRLADARRPDAGPAHAAAHVPPAAPPIESVATRRRTPPRRCARRSWRGRRAVSSSPSPPSATASRPCVGPGASR